MPTLIFCGGIGGLLLQALGRCLAVDGGIFLTHEPPAQIRIDAYAPAPPHLPTRVWLLPALRVTLFCVPTFRQTGVGISLMLERNAAAGWKGAWSDAARIVLGEQGWGCTRGVGGAAAIPRPVLLPPTAPPVQCLPREQQIEVRTLRSPTASHLAPSPTAGLQGHG